MSNSAFSRYTLRFFCGLCGVWVSMIQFTEVSLQLGVKVLFEKLNFTLHARERIGLIGQNGAGKSTLFSMVKGELPADKGEIQFPKNLRLSAVKQETPALAQSAIEYVLDGDPIYRQQQKELDAAEKSEDMDELCKVHEWMLQTDFYAKPSKAGALLHGLGFSFEGQQKSVADFSGGWRMRLNLAQALIADSDVLLLDEPTNHLDLEAVLWLESWLQEYPGILLIISHDRDFLDAVVKGIFWLENKEVKRFAGNYSSFESQRAMHIQQQQAAFAKHQRERGHLESFITRFKAKASKAKQAQSRIKALEKMGDALPAYEKSPFQFSFRENDQPVKDVLVSLSNAVLGYGDKVILEKVQFYVPPDARIGLLGPNGAGKSTLIKALAGESELLGGDRGKSPHLKLGYFSQHQMDILREDQSPLWHMRQLSSNVSEQDARSFLGQFDFKGNVVFDPIKHFSGGEKARLALALIVWQKPNLLLLDEPTNHLDIEMRQALIMALQNYENAVVVISHDRHLLRMITDDLFLVYDGKVQEFQGSIDDYPVWWKTQQKLLSAAQANQKSSQKEKESKIVASSADQKNSGVSRADLVKRCQKFEQELSEGHLKLAKLEALLADSEIYDQKNHANLTRVVKQQKELKIQIESFEEKWLEAISALEAFSKP
jgi:ATP-binding cassette subfamily F protein 3